MMVRRIQGPTRSTRKSPLMVHLRRGTRVWTGTTLCPIGPRHAVLKRADRRRSSWEAPRIPTPGRSGRGPPLHRLVARTTIKRSRRQHLKLSGLSSRREPLSHRSRLACSSRSLACWWRAAAADPTGWIQQSRDPRSPSSVEVEVEARDEASVAGSAPGRTAPAEALTITTPKEGRAARRAHRRVATQPPSPPSTGWGPRRPKDPGRPRARAKTRTRVRQHTSGSLEAANDGVLEAADDADHTAPAEAAPGGTHGVQRTALRREENRAEGPWSFAGAAKHAEAKPHKAGPNLEANTEATQSPRGDGVTGRGDAQPSSPPSTGWGSRRPKDPGRSGARAKARTRARQQSSGPLDAAHDEVLEVAARADHTAPAEAAPGGANGELRTASLLREEYRAEGPLSFAGAAKHRASSRVRLTRPRTSESGTSNDSDPPESEGQDGPHQATHTATVADGPHNFARSAKEWAGSSRSTCGCCPKRPPEPGCWPHAWCNL